jgi:hypothetical protein
MEYDLVEANGRVDLVQRLKWKIAEGWEPIGGVSYANPYYIQAIIRTEASKNKDDLRNHAFDTR